MVFQAEESLYSTKAYAGVENDKYGVAGAKAGRNMVIRDEAPCTSLAVLFQNTRSQSPRPLSTNYALDLAHRVLPFGHQAENPLRDPSTSYWGFVL